jgi:hypothetical protein
VNGRLDSLSDVFDGLTIATRAGRVNTPVHYFCGVSSTSNSPVISAVFDYVDIFSGVSVDRPISQRNIAANSRSTSHSISFGVGSNGGSVDVSAAIIAARHCSTLCSAKWF